MKRLSYYLGRVLPYLTLLLLAALVVMGVLLGREQIDGKARDARLARDEAALQRVDKAVLLPSVKANSDTLAALQARLTADEAQIAALIAQIDAVSKEPGPQGPQGRTGATGPRGAAGPPGPAGCSPTKAHPCP